MSPERLKIGQKELAIGDRYYCPINKLTPHPQPSTIIGGVVEDIRGGGFYGKTLLFKDKDAVIKTAEPDAWHLLWRAVNWELRPFPPQSIKLAAQLDYLSASIIHRIVPRVTDGQIVTPDSIGYADLGKIGYGQALERMRGRGTRFENGLEENIKFTRAREQIWKVGVTLGIEHAAQAHPENPFGKQNIWTTEDGQMIWLDVMPAIHHTGFVWPGFYFHFHKDVRKRIGNGETTFNQLHTERLRSYLEANPNFITGTQKDELDFYLDTYDEISTKYAQEMNLDRRELVIEDALRRGIVTSDQARKLYASDIAYGKFLLGTIAKPAFGAFSDFIQQRMIYRAAFDQQFKADIRRFLRDPNFRRQRIAEHSILRGMREAYSYGLITEAEWNDAWKLIKQPLMPNSEAKKLITTYLSLQAWYIISSSLINAVSVPTMASALIAENPGARFALGLFIDWVVPVIVRGASTAAVSLLTKQDLRTAIKVSALPKVGGYLAVPADLAHRFGKQSEKIWHYTKRGLIVSLSKVLRPWGGWNSDLEAQLWEKLKVEQW